MSLAVLLALMVLLVATVPTSSAHQRHLLSTSINPDGSGTAISDIQFGSLAWEACTSRLTECKPWGRGREIGTDGARRGTVFRVRNALGEVGVSPEWKGPLKALAPPSVSGVIQANDYVSPVPGIWDGGWQGEPAEMQLSACEAEDGKGCVSLTSRRHIRFGCSVSASFSLQPRFTGWYLRVADEQSGGPHAFPASAIYSPSGEYWGIDPVLGRSRNTAVAVVGQIAPATSPAAGECGPPPAPTAAISAAGIARVECAGGCSVTLTGSRRGRRQLVSRQIGRHGLLEAPPALEMSLPASALDALGAGKIRVTVEIDGTRFAQRTIRSAAS